MESMREAFEISFFAHSSVWPMALNTAFVEVFYLFMMARLIELCLSLLTCEAQSSEMRLPP